MPTTYTYTQTHILIPNVSKIHKNMTNITPNNQIMIRTDFYFTNPQSN